jgi:hypothetical protein
VTVPDPVSIIEPKENEVLVLRNEKTLTLTCVARGNPAPQFWWTTDEHFILGMSGDMSDSQKFGKPLNESGGIITNFEESKLASSGTAGYSKVTKIDAGIYKFETMLTVSNVKRNKLYCRAQNVPNDQKEQALRLNIIQNFFIPNESEDEIMSFRKVFTQGQSLNIKCPFVGSPQPEIHWTKDGHEIKSDSNDFVIKDNGVSLFAQQAVSNHSGVYNCSAKIEGVARVTQFDVIVHSPPRIRSISIKGQPIDNTNQTVKVLKGGEAVLECLTEGMPKPTIEWFSKVKNSSKPVTNNKGEIMVGESGTVLKY